MRNFLSTLKQEKQGVAAVEFALVVPTFLILLMGGFEVGYTLYIQSVLNGEVQKAARDSSLETGGTSATQTAVDTILRNTLLALNNSATITIKRNTYQNFTKAEARQPEDANGNGVCELGETWYDRNYSGSYDDDGGVDGQGGAKDVVVYEAFVSYPRIFPVAKLIGLSSNVNLEARTVLANQPFGEQATHSGPITENTCS